MPADPAAPDRVEVTVERAVPGSAFLARDDDGRVVFVEGGLPGERVVVERGRGKAPAHMVELRGPASPDRVEPPCPHVADGCGGCDWQHIAVAGQRRHKVDLVTDALRRIGRLDDPVVEPGPDLPVEGHRTTIRVGVASDGRPGFRARRSHRIVPVDRCLVAHPAAWAALVADPPTDEDTVRVGDHDEVVRSDLGALTITVLGRPMLVSARSFFQTRNDGAEALVLEVRRQLGDRLRPDTRLVDLYCGVGLFGVGLTASPGAPRPDGIDPARGGRVVGVEWSAASADDACSNLDRIGGRAVRHDVGTWSPDPDDAPVADVVVADPSRDGLGRAGVGTVVGIGAPTVVLVSCDAGSLGRDAGLLVAEGYRHERSTLVDLFPHTHHVEVVSTFSR